MVKISLRALKTAEQQDKKRRDTEWANKVKDLDGWTCCICGAKFRVFAHHIINRENLMYKYDIDNGITLCLKHHKFDRTISAHNAPFAFLLWLKKYKFHKYDLARERIVQTLLGDIDLNGV